MITIKFQYLSLCVPIYGNLWGMILITPSSHSGIHFSLLSTRKPTSSICSIRISLINLPQVIWWYSYQKICKSSNKHLQGSHSSKRDKSCTQTHTKKHIGQTMPFKIESWSSNSEHANDVCMTEMKTLKCSKYSSLKHVVSHHFDKHQWARCGLGRDVTMQ